MMLPSRVSLVVLLSAWLFALSGCHSSDASSVVPPSSSPVEDHGTDHDSADSYAGAVKLLNQQSTTIKEAFAVNDIDKAHDPVHEIGHTLESIPALAAKASLAPADQQAIQKAVDDLFECFGQIDGKLHGGEGKTYDEVAEQIQAALDVLQSRNLPRQSQEK